MKIEYLTEDMFNDLMMQKILDNFNKDQKWINNSMYLKYIYNKMGREWIIDALVRYDNLVEMCNDIGLKINGLDIIEIANLFLDTLLILGSQTKNKI